MGSSSPNPIHTDSSEMPFEALRVNGYDPRIGLGAVEVEGGDATAGAGEAGGAPATIAAE